MISKFSPEDKTILIKKKLKFQRWFYLLIGTITISGIILLTCAQIRVMKKENQEFAFCLLLIVHCVWLLISILSTAIYCHITSAVLTTLTIVLLSVYSGIHFYIRYVFYHNQPMEDFHLVTVRLGFVLVLLILLLPWTNVMVHQYRMNILSNKEISSPKSTTFVWFLYLDFMLIVSLLILNIRHQTTFGIHQILFLSIGIPLVILWLCMGILISQNPTRHWLILILFRILSLVQILHLVSTTSRAISEYNTLTKIPASSLLTLHIMTFVCSSANILIHLLTMIISFTLNDI